MQIVNIFLISPGIKVQKCRVSTVENKHCRSPDFISSSGPPVWNSTPFAKHCFLAFSIKIRSVTAPVKTTRLDRSSTGFKNWRKASARTPLSWQTANSPKPSYNSGTVGRDTSEYCSKFVDEKYGQAVPTCINFQSCQQCCIKMTSQTKSRSKVKLTWAFPQSLKSWFFSIPTCCAPWKKMSCILFWYLGLSVWSKPPACEIGIELAIADLHWMQCNYKQKKVKIDIISYEEVMAHHFQLLGTQPELPVIPNQECPIRNHELNLECRVSRWSLSIRLALCHELHIPGKNHA